MLDVLWEKMYNLTIALFRGNCILLDWNKIWASVGVWGVKWTVVP